MSRGTRGRAIYPDDVDYQDFLKSLAEAKAERIVAEALRRLEWRASDLKAQAKGDAAKLRIAARLRLETMLTIRAINQPLQMRSGKSRNCKLDLARAGQAR